MLWILVETSDGENRPSLYRTTHRLLKLEAGFGAERCKPSAGGLPQAHSIEA
jgi:hypothetical protein